MKPSYKPGACPLASHITLRESDRDFTLDGANLMKKRSKDGDNSSAINPKGQVPTLLLDDGMLPTEGVATMQYLVDSVPDRRLLAPTSSLSRHRTIEWLNYTATELHKGFISLLRPDTPENFKPTVRVLLEEKMQHMDGLLEDNQQICDPRLSIAGVHLFTVLCWACVVKLNMAGLSNIGAYMARMAECPAVVATPEAKDLN